MSEHGKYSLKECDICRDHKKFIGHYYWNHLRFVHPVEWTNYKESKIEFGMAKWSHFGKKGEET